jgi:hypothetical protein
MLSQDPVKIASSLRNEATVRYEVVDGGIKIDPVFLISYYDWWQLKAKFTGSYRATSWLEELAKVGSRKEKSINSWPYPRDPYYFRFYDSHTAAIQSGQSGEEEPLEFQKWGTWRLLKWFLGRNGEKLFKRGSVIMLPPILMALVLCFPGGLRAALEAVPVYIRRHITKSPPHMNREGEGSTAAVPESGGRSVTPAEAKGKKELEEYGEAMTLLTRDTVWFAHGWGYRVGETIERGFYAGQQVESIDVLRGVCVVDGERLLFGLRSEAPRSESGNGVREDLPGDGRERGGQGDGQGSPARSPDVARRVDAAPRVPPDDRDGAPRISR